jgi:hypothetical protein
MIGFPTPPHSATSPPPTLSLLRPHTHNARLPRTPAMHACHARLPRTPATHACHAPTHPRLPRTPTAPAPVPAQSSRPLCLSGSSHRVLCRWHSAGMHALFCLVSIAVSSYLGRRVRGLLVQLPHTYTSVSLILVYLSLSKRYFYRVSVS